VIEEGVDISMPFENIYDFQHVADIPKENHVISNRKAAQIGSQLGSEAAEWKSGCRQIGASPAQICCEAEGDIAIAALPQNVEGYFRQILTGGCCVTKPRHPNGTR
jgi:hypothetical protein